MLVSMQNIYSSNSYDFLTDTFTVQHENVVAL